MAWEISMSIEGWEQVNHNLQCHTQKGDLVAAILDDEFRDDAEKDEEREQREKLLYQLPTDILADNAFELIEGNNTCDNGGFAVWIDKEGYYKVPVSLQCTEDGCFEGKKG